MDFTLHFFLMHSGTQSFFAHRQHLLRESILWVKSYRIRQLKTVQLRWRLKDVPKLRDNPEIHTMQFTFLINRTIMEIRRGERVRHYISRIFKNHFCCRFTPDFALSIEGKFGILKQRRSHLLLTKVYCWKIRSRMMWDIFGEIPPIHAKRGSCCEHNLREQDVGSS